MEVSMIPGETMLIRALEPSSQVRLREKASSAPLVAE